MKTRWLLLVSFAMFPLVSSSRAQIVHFEPVYDNLGRSRPLNQYLNEGSLENGDQVTLTGNGPFTIALFTFEYFLDSTKLVGGENLEVRFYDLSGAPLRPGAVPFYDSGLFPITPNPFHTVRLTLGPNVEVPKTFVWSLQFTGGNIAGGSVAGPTLYSGPAYGYGSNQYGWWQKNPTWEFYSDHQTDFGAYIASGPIPEPGATAAVLLCVAAGVVLVLRRNQPARLAACRTAN